jgi:3-hydroxyisobutyrate dehydrogenase-like beta-hydroxyacid dehydrogenase
MGADGTTVEHVALIGFGEAGCAIAEGWRDAALPIRIAAYDIKSDVPATADDMSARYARHDVDGAATLTDALGRASAVFSLVTADAAREAARAAAELIPAGTLYFDCNSCAPETKRGSAALIEKAGGRYVDAAIMSPIRPKRHEAPILLSGPHADAAWALTRRLGMQAEILPGEVGRASSVKMIRSIMVKGLEALTLECMLSAVKAGVDKEVIASLDASMPGWDWAARAAYNMERATTHGVRRAAEMREVAQTISDLGLPPRMAPATVAWQQDMGDLGLAGGSDDYQERARAILAALNHAQLEETS